MPSRINKTTAYCLLIDSALISYTGVGGLYGGRKCSSDTNCYSGSGDGQCSGLGEGEYGYEHADCKANLFCKKESIWPYRARCNDLLGNMENCNNDYECGISFFCWYATSSEKALGIKRCLEKYSASDDQTFGWSTSLSPLLPDQEYNGLFCKSGFAVSTATNLATCKAVTKIMYNGATLSSPYSCNPTDTSTKGQLFYGTGASDYYSVDGEGALDGKNGYCSRIVGTTEYK